MFLKKVMEVSDYLSSEVMMRGSNPLCHGTQSQQSLGFEDDIIAIHHQRPHPLNSQTAGRKLDKNL